MCIRDRLEGVIDTDGDTALYRLSALDHTLTWPPGRVTLPGLDPDRRYQVQVLASGDRVGSGTVVPGWVRDGVTLTGRVLGEVGLQAPLLDADHLVVLLASAVEP